MGRRRRNNSEPCCYHVTHRCHGRSFLFRFKHDRRSYLERLRETALRFDISVLDYMVTSNHVHLLIYSSSASVLSKAMHHLQGNTARDYNRRKGREGAFWRGRYHPTMIENGEHLARCLFYIDVNMVRARACPHPSKWFGGSYREMTGSRRRYRILDMQRLLECLMHPGDIHGFSQWYDLTLRDCIGRYSPAREPVWSECIAVGGKEWLQKLGAGLHGAEISPVPASGLFARETDGTYALSGPARTMEEFWKRQENKR